MILYASIGNKKMKISSLLYSFYSMCSQRYRSTVWQCSYSKEKSQCRKRLVTTAAETGRSHVSWKQKKERIVLGIESSCDDTGVAIVSSSGQILGDSLKSQADIHAEWGGVVPKLAQEAHRMAIDSCVQEALDNAGIEKSKLDAVAVTIGPGLSLCLQVGVLKARQIAAEASIPLIPIHHMEAHALVSRIPLACEKAADSTSSPIVFPFLCLLISGGHNLLLIVEGIGKYIQLGTTLDDALGEGYDKVARMLGLELKPSGGAILEVLARKGNPTAFKFTRPLNRRRTCDFSYAGLKTAVRLKIEEVLSPEAVTEMEEEEILQIKADIAASFQRVAVAHLEERCKRAIEWARESHPEINHLVVAGGVASNLYVRQKLQELASSASLDLVCPPPNLCTDNGVMVAWTGVERLEQGLGIEAVPELESLDDDGWVDLRPRWPLTDRRDPRSFQAPRSAKKKNLFKSLEMLTNDMPTKATTTGTASGASTPIL